jgi:hypothetical protein
MPRAGLRYPVLSEEVKDRADDTIHVKVLKLGKPPYEWDPGFCAIVFD